MKPINNVLIVLLKDKSDFIIAQEQLWYRIPVESRLPINLQNETAEFIAFYFGFVAWLRWLPFNRFGHPQFRESI